MKYYGDLALITSFPQTLSKLLVLAHVLLKTPARFHVLFKSLGLIWDLFKLFVVEDILSFLSPLFLLSTNPFTPYSHSVIYYTCRHPRDVIVGPKLSQIGPKWDKSGQSDQISSQS